MSKKFDLILIGAGVLGTFHAYHALKRGLKVLLLEKDQYPINATVRNFGQCVPSGLSSEWFEYGSRSTEIYNEIQKEFDITVRNNGSVYIASTEGERNVLHELKSIMDERAYQADILSHHQCLEHWPDLRHEYVKEGLFFPQEVSVEPEKMIYRLIEYLIIKFPNLTYRSATSVVGCDVVSGQVVATLAEGSTFIGDKAIICNGHEFKILFADLFKASGIVVCKLQMMRTYPMPSVKMEGNILTSLTIHRYESFQECLSFKSLTTLYEHQELKKWGIHILFKKAVDGSIIIGDSHEYADVIDTDNLGFSISTKINDLMLTEAQKIVSFNVKNVATSWAGFYSQHPSKNIVEYDIDRRIHIRTAVGGKGMSCSAGYAEHSINQIFK